MKQWEKMDALAQQAQYSRHMADYQLTLALPAAAQLRLSRAMRDGGMDDEKAWATVTQHQEQVNHPFA